MIIFHCLQSSATWWQLRLGVPTSSRFSSIIQPSTGKPSKGQDKYIEELIGEITQPGTTTKYLSAHQNMRPMTKEMEGGNLLEPQARKYYALARNCHVEEIGFIQTDDMRFGCSPDGLVDRRIGLELKCPLDKTFLAYQRKGILPLEYKAQVHGHLIVAELDAVDFMAYTIHFGAFLIRVERDEFTDLLEAELDRFHEKYTARLKASLGWTYDEALAYARHEIGHVEHEVYLRKAVA